ncbi:Cgl0159 family (beta/alpha)8-fold protein [Actinocatenispora rupis]|uniref:Aldolase n=1 Tax=Actinocatenispora rupis TaxID=519421 RepID=A0A8J3J370_9ACTN|nr:aldolase [Actinocatenispora rupis]GID14981.1 aldolase [Actinocatenispora rupis]
MTELRARLAELRATRPDAVRRAAVDRGPGPSLAEAGRFLLIAADHPARGSLAVGDRADAMADRGELLSRLLVALSRPGVAGVLGTPDVVEDLLLLGALDGKVVVGSMNRGGVPGTVFEIDDRFTAYDAATLADMRLQGGKMLLRIDPDDRSSADTLEGCARAVSALADRTLVAMVEPFWVRRDRGGRAVNDLSTDAVVRSVAIAQALGSRSAYTWLKLPVVPDMPRVLAATTLPTVLLGGDPHGAPDETYAAWRDALGLPGVRGLVVGRSLLYPPDDDVAAAVDTAAEML